MDTSSKEIETSDELIIVNRSKTYYVSKKKICSLVPYFEKMFCCDLLESKENKVTLDLDEDAFKSILNAVFSRSYVLHIEKVLQMSKVADYLMIDEFHDEFLQFFQKKFSIQYIPNVLLSVDEFSKLINLRMVNSFIEAHFLKIVNTTVFLNYPIETIKHIVSLNLQINSEYQVYEAILSWIKWWLESRKVHILQLLMCIRWCHLKQQEMEMIKKDDLIKDLSEFEAIICQPDSCKGHCAKRRAKSKSLIVVSEVENSGIELLIIEENYSCISSGYFVKCDSLRSNLIADENITEIIYDSGRKGIVVSWKQKKFQYLKMFGSNDEYYCQLYRYIMCFQPNERPDKIYLEKRVARVRTVSLVSNAFLEFDGQFHVIGSTLWERRLFALFPIQLHSWYINNLTWEPALHSCLNDNKILVITREGVHRLTNTDTWTSTDIQLIDDQKFAFYNLQLTSLGSEFYLFDKLSKKIYILDEVSKNWNELVEIRSPYKAITLTTAYLPDETVETLFKIS